MQNPFTLSLPDFALVVLIGVSGSGKSTFARRHFLPSEVLSSDAFRAWVSDDENDQGATTDAFEALHFLAGIRLRRRKLVVIDATNVQPQARKPLIELAHRHDCLAAAIVLDVPERVCRARNAARADRQFGPHVIANQGRQLRQSMRGLKREGFRYVWTLDEGQIETAQIARVPLWTDRRADAGPFDLIGDIHGCYAPLTALLGALGYVHGADTDAWAHPQGRRAVFLGDLVDRGPQVVETVRLVQGMVAAGSALCVPGNHDMKLMRALKGNPVTVGHGLAESLAQIEALPEPEREAFKTAYIAFADGLVSHYWLDGGRLCVAHAGLKEEYIGRASSRVRDFALYGEATGEVDEFGLPIRLLWAADYRGATTVVYGHTPVREAQWLNNTINIDTGCVFGGKLTALRWPERELVQVPGLPVDPALHPTFRDLGNRRSDDSAGVDAGVTSHEPGAEESSVSNDALASLAPDGAIETRLPSAERSAEGPAKRRGLHREAEPDGSFTARIAPETGLSLQWEHDEILRAEDVLGKRMIETRLISRVMVPAENAAAALETMSRFAVEPRWLIYLPPTMSPCETAPEGDLLERPAEAFAYYRSQGVETVVCQRKHMGSRAVLIVCRDEAAARRRFGATMGEIGQCVTRTGRQFFDDMDLNRGMLEAAADGLTRAGFWEEFQTDWVCLDCELMPWNAKAQGLLREQYAPVAAAARGALGSAVATLEAAQGRGLPVESLLTGLRSRQEDAARYAAAYARYCWEVSGLADLKLAPFHLLATEGRTYFDRDHDWHAATLARLADGSDLFLATESLTVETADETSLEAGSAWWQAMTGAGGEGMVVKPQAFVARGQHGLTQPAVKVRGREYLRIIYGPEYTEPANLERLRARGLGRKRSLALREFALGVEALERFVRREPLRRVHECVFGVLALESEPVDPRL